MMLSRMTVLWHNEEGATMVEYAVMFALFAIACLLLLMALGVDINQLLYKVQSRLPPGNGLVQPTP